MDKSNKGIKLFYSLSLNEKLSLLLMVYLLAKYRLITFYIPLRYYYNRYFNTPNSQNTVPEIQIRKIRRLLKISRLLPFSTPCLVESLAIKEYLKLRGISISINLGVKIEGEALSAHAWCFSHQSQQFHTINVYNGK